MQQSSIADTSRADPIRAAFDCQRADYASAPYPTLDVRKDRLRRARSALVENRNRIVEAINSDFGNRPRLISLLTDVLHPVRALKHAEGHLRKWMKPEKRKADFPMGVIGGRAYVQYQPLGVVGVMAPWNAPVALCLTPLAGILAAGNRALIKPSEVTEATSAVIKEMIESAFAPEEVAVVCGGVEAAKTFSALPFDHLLFTGGASVARHVMRAASENLTPVTLELGGKSPAIVAEGADVKGAARSIVNGRFINGGQICMAPDYALVWRPHLEEFRQQALAAAREFYPTEREAADITHVIGEEARERHQALIEEARALGAQVDLVPVASSPADNAPSPLAFVTAPDISTRLLREEIFGPILPIVPFDNFDEVFAIAANIPKPLAAYIFGGSETMRQRVIRELPSGGMTIGDVMLHPFLQNLPFGGVGESGMGQYIGFDGFRTFSHGKAVLHRPRLDLGKYLFPPYSKKAERLLERVIKS